MDLFSGHRKKLYGNVVSDRVVGSHICIQCLGASELTLKSEANYFLNKRGRTHLFLLKRDWSLNPDGIHGRKEDSSG